MPLLQLRENREEDLPSFRRRCIPGIVRDIGIFVSFLIQGRSAISRKIIWF
jgi:hypothetical protein